MLCCAWVGFFPPSFCRIVLPSSSLCYCVFFREGFFVVEGGYRVIHCSFRVNSGLFGKIRGTDYSGFQRVLRPRQLGAGSRFVVSGFFSPLSTLKAKAVIHHGIRNRGMSVHFAKKTFRFLKLKPCLHYT